MTFRKVTVSAVLAVRKLRTAEQLLNQGQAVADVCRALEVSPATYHRWQNLYGGMKATEVEIAAACSVRVVAMAISDDEGLRS